MSGAVVMRIPKPLSLKPETQNPKPETLNPALQKVPSGLGVSSPPGSRSAGGSGLFALRSWGFGFREALGLELRVCALGFRV